MGASRFGERRTSREPADVMVRTNLIFVCSPTGAALPQAKDEAIDIANAVPSHIRRGGSAECLQKELMDGQGCYRFFLFSGHGVAQAVNGEVATTSSAAPPSAASASAGDSPLASSAAPPPGLRIHNRTLGFTDAPTGRLVVANGQRLAEMLAGHGLELIFLNGCDTVAFARQLRGAGVPHVVCWRTLVEDSAARCFSVVFFTALGKHGRTVREAFEDARQAVMVQTRPAVTASGAPMAHDVSRFELRDPASGPPESPAGYTSRGLPLPMAAGVPLLLSVDGDLDGDCTKLSVPSEAPVLLKASPLASRPPPADQAQLSPSP